MDDLKIFVLEVSAYPPNTKFSGDGPWPVFKHFIAVGISEEIVLKNIRKKLCYSNNWPIKIIKEHHIRDGEVFSISKW